ncbi:Formate dehydrogenase-O subunit gamma [Hartmannibacter diazotrophicus]|uniref:Formate dehydrogenase-O subunit gamma n=1 Tax=Hartmannibacter diazotrophicus TaxID=1482074 RepID=A0A2C9D4S8_9HYPH|nr:formate dehydrogenase subunit gamma [Hartmannibacter diazotrophicus]SON55296.1 Formate dehydrogenase-O subunit gamma [Hartmannibacter diazotrophicus]
MHATAGPDRLPVFRALMWLAAIVVALFLVLPSPSLAQSSVRPPDNAVSTSAPDAVGGNPPGGALGNTSDSDLWRGVKAGMTGNITIPDSKAATLIQAGGEDWRSLRNGSLYDYFGLAIVGTLLLLSLFFALRGRIRVEKGLSGVLIPRFSGLERMAHWLMALSFIILAISGLNISFGRELVMPIIGKDLFGPMSAFLKLSHNYVAFAFMLGLAIAFVTWVIHNVPNRHDIVWLAKAGGLLSKHSHPPAKKFNAGQKLIFWSVMLCGLSLCISGWALLYPFHYTFFSDTFTALKGIGIDIPALTGLPDTPYAPIMEQQLNTIWHAAMAVFLICVILAHIYIGSIGMEGAFDAMGSGEVDLNWAREHHSLWVEEMTSEGTSQRPRPYRGQAAE